MSKKITFLMFAAFILTGVNSFAQDASLQNLALSAYLKTNTDYALSVQLVNNDGYNYITSVSVSWSLDNGTMHTYGPTGISGGLPSGGYYLPITFSQSLNVGTTGQHTLKVWANAAGETNSSNDSITFHFIALSAFAPKVALLEEATAEWCEHCPPAGAVTDVLSSRSDVAIVRYHFTDQLAFSDDQTYYQNYFTLIGSNGFFPAATVDMGEGGNYNVNDNYPNWTNDAESQGGISPLSLAITSSINPSTRVATVTLTGNFKYAETGNYFFNAFILESNIVQTQTLENLSQDNSFVHNNVLRALMGGIDGTSGIIPNTPVINTDYAKTYTFTIPSDWDITNISFVGSVFKVDNNGNKTAVNSAKSNSSTGVNTVQAENNLHAYPIPFMNGLTVNVPDNNQQVNASVFSVDGKMFINEEYSLENGQFYLDLENRNLVPGFYTLIVTTKENTYSKKIIKY